MLNIHRLTWAQFDGAVEVLASKIVVPVGCLGVCGEPRGGLPLAIALSHRLNIPFLVDQPDANFIWVDDIYDTGGTAQQQRDRASNGVIQCFWISKVPNVIAASYETDDIWFKFPWEINPEKDMADYAIRS